MDSIVENIDTILLLVAIALALIYLRSQNRTAKKDIVQDKARQAKDNYEKVVQMILRREFRDEPGNEPTARRLKYDFPSVVDLEDEIVKAGLAAIDAALGNARDES